MTSLFECHNKVVAELRAKCEPVIPANDGSMMKSAFGGDRPTCYTKEPLDDGKIYFGSAVKNKDGSYSILLEMLTGKIGDLSLDEIGLCDPKCFYEYIDGVPFNGYTYPGKEKITEPEEVRTVYIPAGEYTADELRKFISDAMDDKV